MGCSYRAGVQRSRSHIDFLILHTYPIWYETYTTYSTSNPNFQARQIANPNPIAPPFCLSCC